MRITSGGSVGIGTCNPSFKLDICTAQSIRVIGSSTGYTQGSIIFQSSTTDTPEARGLGVYAFNEGTDATWFYGTAYNAGDSFAINRKSGTTYQDAAASVGEACTFLLIKNNGNVGIRTTVGTAGLGIGGTGQTTANLTDAGSRSGIIEIIPVGGEAGNGGALVLGSDTWGTGVGRGQIALKAMLTDGSGCGVSDLAFSLRNNSACSNLTERMRITSAGEILAGTTSAGVGYVAVSKIGSYQAYTSDSNTTTLSTQRTAGFFGVDGGSSSNNQGSYTALTANVAWGASNNPGSIFRGYQSSTLSVQICYNGNLTNTNGSYGTISSDRRVKENIVSATQKLDDLMKLNVVNFNLIGNEEKHIGFIAQDMQEVFPSFVYQSDTRKYDKNGNLISGFEDTLGLKVGMEFAILTKAIQEQQCTICSQASRITLLESCLGIA